MTAENRINYLFLGFGLGTAAAILFAPKAGVETRSKIEGRLREGHKYVKRQSQELLDSASTTVGRGRKVLRNQMLGVSEAIAAGKTAYLQRVS